MVQIKLESGVDLAGCARPQSLTADHDGIVIGRGLPANEQRFEWRQIEQFRIESSVGSCFLQARIAGMWVDLLRAAAPTQPDLTETLALLNARCKTGSHGYCAPEQEARNATPPGELPHPSPQPATDSPDTQWIAALLRPFRRHVLLLLVLSLVAVVIEVIPPMLQARLVDDVLKPQIIGNPVAELLTLLLAIVLGLFLARLGAAIVAVWKGRVSSYVGTGMTANLRSQLVEKLNRLPLSFYDRNQTGMLMSQVAYDTETLHTLVYHATSGVLLQLLQLIVIGVMLFYLNAQLALLALLPVPLIIAGSWYFTRRLQPRHHRYWEAVGGQASALMGMLSGVRVVKAFVQERQENRRFRSSSEKLRQSRLDVDYSTSAFAAGMGLLFAVGTLAAWYLGGQQVVFSRMTLGGLVAFLQYLAMFYTPLTSIVESTTWFSNFLSVSRRIQELLKTPDESHADLPGGAIDGVAGHVELRNVTFGYNTSRPVLSNVSVSIEPGEMIGVVGRSGSGKSTLVNLIARLYEADSGQVLVDGIDVRRLDPGQLRRHIGMVPQEPFLFRGTVAANLAYGKPEAAFERVLDAARQADAHDFIMRMPLAYSTQLGEGGTGLSGGERQRLSIARALLFDPAILILDEATASVDVQSERVICRAIRCWARGRTAIVIAHRLSTIQEADRLLVFDEGRLVECGSPQELLSRDGHYRRMVNVHGGLTDHAQSFDCETAVDDVQNAPIEECDTQFGQVTWLEPDQVIIRDTGLGLLRVFVDGKQFDAVRAYRALPARWTDEYISLRCDETSIRCGELGMIRSLAAWDSGSRDAVERSLQRRYLIRSVREIEDIHSRGSEVTLSVRTDAGPVTVCLEKPGDSTQPFGDDGLLITDKTGSLFLIPNRHALPNRQQRLLSNYVAD